MQKAQKQIVMIFLALAVVLLAPFKALSTPINAIPEEACAVVSACCVKMAHCCCEITPKPPSDMDSAAVLPAPPKFVAIKGSGRIISQDLPKPLVRFTPQDIQIFVTSRPAIVTTPLYILNRALLI
ncbi:MAG: hypothetical protein JSS86_23970 [Cyanobacteria bacterium SZAS LIN-2]|nr:hypothetical protein [Cyanobacteria bacterium SZAS LIN-3]MBS1999414.1 hypothetical protein [Cyanobacteria bacterium SZAS LIN-2]MBS2010686.1 hypothetical protein [Cyanobacteria bacterium SZAS TMP-1]